MLRFLILLLLAWCSFCFLYTVVLYNQTYDELTSTLGKKAEFKQKPSIAIACAFNYKIDEQRKEYVSVSAQYISKWYDSLSKHPNMHGVVLSNMFDHEFRANYSTDRIQFIHIDPSSHPSFINVANSSERSINDQVYFVAEWFLYVYLFITRKFRTHKLLIRNSTQGQYEYALLTDMHDVAFNRDPFQYMRGVDELIGKSQLFVQTEYKADYYAEPWIRFYWKNCFQEERGNQSILYNSGIVGAEAEHLRSFLHRMNSMFLKSWPGYICDMAIFGKIIERDYLDNVITGYPFHSKFKHEFDPEPGFDELTYIKHK